MDEERRLYKERTVGVWKRNRGVFCLRFIERTTRLVRSGVEVEVWGMTFCVPTPVVYGRTGLSTTPRLRGVETGLVERVPKRRGDRNPFLCSVQLGSHLLQFKVRK